MAAADLKVPCPHCKCPDQHVGLQCGFCNTPIPVPRSAVAPDGTACVEEVIGYRGWKIARTDDGVRLCSPIFPMMWTPGEWMVAECHSRAAMADDHRHAHDDPGNWPPVKGCGGGGHGCGFYAGRTREHLIQLGYGRYTQSDPSVIGRVQMQGKIIPAANGWRAQMCRTRTIYVPYELWELARDLKEAYGPHGVEVEVGATLVLPAEGEDAIKWCKRCKAKMSRDPRCGFCGHTHT
jgi:hypothetical protein